MLKIRIKIYKNQTLYVIIIFNKYIKQYNFGRFYAVLKKSL